MSDEQITSEYAQLSDARLAKKIRHLVRTIRRPLAASTVERLLRFLDIAYTEAQKRGHP